MPLPDQVALPIAAAAPLMLTTALLLLTDAARFRPGDSVLVHGASGGIGSAVAQLVPALGGGLRIGTVGRPDSVTAALDNGYDVALAWTEDVPAAVLAATNGVGADTCSTRRAPSCSTPIWPSPPPAAGSCCSATPAAASWRRCRRSAG